MSPNGVFYEGGRIESYCRVEWWEVNVQVREQMEARDLE